MSRIQRKLKAQIDGLLLAAIGTLVLLACAAPAAPPAVIITDGSRFAPATLTGRVGEPIVWRNRSPDRHSIVVTAALPDGAAPPPPGGDGGPRSGDLYHNEEWSHTFEQPGTYRFACAIHQADDMVGVLSVVE
jgi:plastocyanin